MARYQKVTDCVKIQAGRKAVDAYREAHRRLHEKGWHKGIDEEHVPLIRVLEEKLKELGFTSLEQFTMQAEKYPLSKPVKLAIVHTQKAFEETFEARKKDLIPDTLAISFYHDSCVVVGVSNPVEEVVDEAACKKAGIAIYHTGCPGASILIRAPMAAAVSLAVKSDINIKSQFMEFLIKVFKKLGVIAYRREGKNDILYGGKKLSGVTGQHGEGTQFLMGFFNLDFDFDLAEKLLRIPAEKEAHDHPPSIRDWATSVRQITGRQSVLEAPLIVDAFKETFGVEVIQ